MGRSICALQLTLESLEVTQAVDSYQRTPTVSPNILNGPEAGRGQNTPTTAPSCFSRRHVLQQISTDHWKSTNNAYTTAQPGQHQKAQNDVNGIPPHNNTTHFLRGWSKYTSTTFYTLTASPPDRLCLPFNLGIPASARPIEGRG